MVEANNLSSRPASAANTRRKIAPPFLWSIDRGEGSFCLFLSTKRSKSISALLSHADAARDARNFRKAASLYSTVLRLTQDNGPIHVQCAHMHKEIGAFRKAERHYLAAQTLMPNDADIWLQLGHFYKVAGRIPEAVSAYQQATTLDPEWDDPVRELQRLKVQKAPQLAFSRPEWPRSAESTREAEDSPETAKLVEELRWRLDNVLADSDAQRRKAAELEAQLEQITRSHSWKFLGRLHVIELRLRSLARNLTYASLKEELDARRISAWPAFDHRYVSWQLGEERGDRLQIARRFIKASKERRIRPNPFFDPLYYRNAHKAPRNVNPLIHYLRFGMRQGLQPAHLFDPLWYRQELQEKLPDEAVPLDVIHHFVSFGRHRRLWPVNPASFTVCPTVERIFFSGGVDSEAFDLEIYRTMNPDLEHMSDADLHAHYQEQHPYETRICSISTFLRSAKILPEWVPLDFRAAEYASLHTDMSDREDQTLQLLDHYLRYGLKEGRAYGFDDMFAGAGRISKKTFSDELLSSPLERKPLCVLVHLYYPDMWDEIKDYLVNLDVDFDLRVNFVDTTWTNESIKKVRLFKPGAAIYISPNKGRDIGGFLRLLDSVRFRSYTAFCLLHSKKSPHVTSARVQMWKRDLMGCLLGSANLARQNIAAFLEDPKVGIIGSAKWRSTDIGNNREQFEAMLNLFKIRPEFRHCEFLSGTMMMVRSEILEELYHQLKNVDLESGDASSLSFHLDGQVAHAIERIFGNITLNKGYEFLWR